MKLTLAELDFTGVTKNEAVRQQGIQTCLLTQSKGWFSIELERFCSRQDLAVITNKREVEVKCNDLMYLVKQFS